jgi:hypothetical protein
VGLKFNGAHQLLSYADGVNLLRGNMDNIKKNTETLLDDSKNVGLERNVERTMNMLLAYHRNAGQNHNLKIANRSFENVAQFKYLGTVVTHQNLTQEEIKRRMNYGNACCHSVRSPLSYHLLSKYLYRCKTWPLTIREKHGLRLFESRC